MVGVGHPQRVAGEFNQRVLEARRGAEKRGARLRACRMARRCTGGVAVGHAGNAPDAFKLSEGIASPNGFGRHPDSFRLACRGGGNRLGNRRVRLLALIKISDESDLNF